MMKLFVINIPSIILFSVAAVLAFDGKDGWGWFLIVGLLMGHVIRGSDDY